MRLRAPLLVVPLMLAACSTTTDGPASPIAPAQLTPAPALDASASRQAVVEFIEAYRASPQEGIGPLFSLVAGRNLAEWVRWLNVQHREFEGGIQAISDVRDVEFVGAISEEETSSAQVGLSASVIFTFSPIGDDPIELVRVLDGPVTLVRTAPATYRVFDLLRNGVPMSDGIISFRNQQRTRGDVTVRMDSLFMFPPNWQFNIIIENRSDVDLVLDPAGAALFVEGADGFERVDGVVTGSLEVVPAGAAIDGLMVFSRTALRVPARRPRHGCSSSPSHRRGLGTGRTQLAPSPASQVSTPWLARLSASLLRSRGICSYVTRSNPAASPRAS
jgi:hypothetical protein